MGAGTHHPGFHLGVRTLLVSSTTASQSSSMKSIPPWPTRHRHYRLKDTVISSRYYTAQQEGRTLGKSACDPFSFWALCATLGAPMVGRSWRAGLVSRTFRMLIGAIPREKEVSCLLDFPLSCVRNEWFIGVEKLT